MIRLLRARLAGAVLVALLAATASLATTSCDPVSRGWAWKLGDTHGAIIETTAGRASLAIYRVPSEALYGYSTARGVKGAQDLLWRFGKPPELTKRFRYRGHSITLSFGWGTAALRDVAKGVIYDHDDDLRHALGDAHHRRSCLAVTLISYGRPTINWTQKQTDCRDGRLPS